MGCEQLLFGLRGGRHAGARLDLGPGVRDALRFTFERWNGNGFPTHAKGEAIPAAMRVVHLSQDMEAIGRIFSPARAIEAARERRDQTYDPALADLFIAQGAGWFDLLTKIGAVGRRARSGAETSTHAGGRSSRQRAYGSGRLY